MYQSFDCDCADFTQTLTHVGTFQMGPLLSWLPCSRWPDVQGSANGSCMRFEVLLMHRVPIPHEDRRHDTLVGKAIGLAELVRSLITSHALSLWWMLARQSRWCSFPRNPTTIMLFFFQTSKSIPIDWWYLFWTI